MCHQQLRESLCSLYKPHATSETGDGGACHRESTLVWLHVFVTILRCIEHRLATFCPFCCLVCDADAGRVSVGQFVFHVDEAVVGMVCGKGEQSVHRRIEDMLVGVYRQRLIPFLGISDSHSRLIVALGAACGSEQ